MRVNLVTGGLLALAALQPLTAQAESAGPTPPPTALSPHPGAAVSEIHFRAHLETRAVLDPAQIARYAERRGYAPAGGLAPTGTEHGGPFDSPRRSAGD